MEPGSRNERVELDLSSSAAIAFVCVSAFFCCLLILAYCHCYCREIRNGGTSWRCLFKKKKPFSPLLLPVVLYRKGKEEDLTRGCVVCLSEFEDDEAVKVIPGCGHVFHPSCIDQWLGLHRSCPVCRCSTIFGNGRMSSENSINQEVVIQVREQEEEMEIGGLEARLARSVSWCLRDGDHRDRERVALRRACSM